MFSWNLRRYWNEWHYELHLQLFPNRPILDQQHQLTHQELQHQELQYQELQQQALPHQELQQQQQQQQQRQSLPPTFIHRSEAPQPQEGEDDHKLVDFIRRCYMLTGIFIALSLSQWVLFAYLAGRKGIYLMTGFVCFILAISSLFMLTFCLRVRGNHWFGLLFAWCFVETVAMGMVLLLPNRTVNHILVAFVATELVLFILYFLGAWIPMILLPGEITLLVLLILFVVAGTLALTMYIVTGQAFYQTIYFSVMGSATLLFALYHAPNVHGRRFQVPIEQCMQYAMIIYLHFTLLFVSIYHIMWVHQWTDLGILNKKF